MGGRGARVGVYQRRKQQHLYGDEYHSVYQFGNIKFIQINEGSVVAPLETMTKGRVYAVIDNQNRVKYVSYYDKKGKKYKQIDVSGPPHKIDGKSELPHTHIGYDMHKGTAADTRVLTDKERKMVDRVLKTWNYFLNK